jgi:hypothetical protein
MFEGGLELWLNFAAVGGHILFVTTGEGAHKEFIYPTHQIIW